MGALKLAEKLRGSIEQAAIPGLGGLSASLGVAVYPDDAVETEQLLRQADRALYVAKERGRNRVEMAAATSDGEAAWRDAAETGPLSAAPEAPAGRLARPA